MTLFSNCKLHFGLVKKANQPVASQPVSQQTPLVVLTFLEKLLINERTGVVAAFEKRVFHWRAFQFPNCFHMQKILDFMRQFSGSFIISLMMFALLAFTPVSLFFP